MKFFILVCIVFGLSSIHVVNGQGFKLALEGGLGYALSHVTSKVPFNSDSYRVLGIPGINIGLSGTNYFSPKSALSPYLQVENRNFRAQEITLMTDPNGGALRDYTHYMIANFYVNPGLLYVYKQSEKMELVGGVTGNFLLMSKSKFFEGFTTATGEIMPGWFNNRYYRKFNISLPVGVRYYLKNVYLTGLCNITPFSVITSYNKQLQERNYTFMVNIGYQFGN